MLVATCMHLMYMYVIASINLFCVAARYSVVDLLRVTSLARSRLERGVDVRTSLQYAAVEVYAKPLLDPHTRQVTERLCNFRFIRY